MRHPDRATFIVLRRGGPTGWEHIDSIIRGDHMGDKDSALEALGLAVEEHGPEAGEFVSILEPARPWYSVEYQDQPGSQMSIPVIRAAP